MWYGFLLQIVFGIPFGTNPAPDWILWIFWLVFGIGLPVLVYTTKLITAVKKESVFIRFVPFTSKEIPYSQIDHVEARTYKPIKEFGGWGIRWGSGKRKAYNISGDTGVELILKNGKSILIGSQREEELAFSIKRNMNKSQAVEKVMRRF
jgi:hypothetical protein